MRRYAILVTVLLAATSAFAQKQPKPKNKSEETAIRAMFAAQDDAGRIKAADELITKFADTEFKSIALFVAADSYARMGNTEKAIVFGEQTIEADPKNYQAQILLATLYALSIKPNDLDKQEKLTKTAKFANDSLDILKTAEKPNPQITDAEWVTSKNDLLSQAYLALGIVAAYQNKMDDVTVNFTHVAELGREPLDLVRGGRVLFDLKKYSAAIPWFEKAAASPGVAPQIKQIAEADIARAKAAGGK